MQLTMESPVEQGKSGARWNPVATRKGASASLGRRWSNNQGQMRSAPSVVKKSSRRSRESLRAWWVESNPSWYMSSMVLPLGLHEAFNSNYYNGTLKAAGKSGWIGGFGLQNYIIAEFSFDFEDEFER
jgi:hypothetical protein